MLEDIVLVNLRCENSLQISHVKTVSYTFEVQRDGEEGLSTQSV